MSDRYYKMFRDSAKFVSTFDSSFYLHIPKLGTWPVPNDREPAAWVENDTHSVQELILLTRRGLLLRCCQEFLFRAEAYGEPLEICSAYDVRVTKARLLYRVANWNYVSGARFSLACLERANKRLTDSDIELSRLATQGVEITHKYSEAWDIYIQSRGLEKTSAYYPDTLYEVGWETLCDEACDFDEKLREKENEPHSHSDLLEATRCCLNSVMNYDWYEWPVHVASYARKAIAYYLVIQQESPINLKDEEQIKRCDKLLAEKTTEEEIWQSQYLTMLLGENQ